MIELEDRRYVTQMQAANYSDKELLLNPHLNGFDLSQLIDWCNAVCISKQKSDLTLGYLGSFGLCNYLVKYFGYYWPEFKLVCVIEDDNVVDTPAYRQLKANSNQLKLISLAATQYSEIYYEFKECDFFLLARRHKQDEMFFETLLTSAVSKHKPLAVADLQLNCLNYTHGSYYLGSNIWTTDSSKSVV
jgi:hypothetical protein